MSRLEDVQAAMQTLVDRTAFASGRRFEDARGTDELFVHTREAVAGATGTARGRAILGMLVLMVGSVTALVFSLLGLALAAVLLERRRSASAADSALRPGGP
jgi:hypothetical protein